MRKPAEWLRLAHGLLETPYLDDAMATFACATFMQVGARRARFAPAFFLSGVALFSGSLYALALGADRWVGLITPFGGVLFLIGWGVLACSASGVDGG